MKSTIEEGAVKYKLKEEDRKKILDQVTSWLEKNQGAEKEELEDKLKEREKVCMPLVYQVVHLGGGGGGGSKGTRGRKENWRCWVYLEEAPRLVQP